MNLCLEDLYLALELLILLNKPNFLLVQHGLPVMVDQNLPPKVLDLPRACKLPIHLIDLVLEILHIHLHFLLDLDMRPVGSLGPLRLVLQPPVHLNPNTASPDSLHEALREPIIKHSLLLDSDLDLAGHGVALCAQHIAEYSLHGRVVEVLGEQLLQGAQDLG